jgi:hypothetical protein
MMDRMILLLVVITVVLVFSRCDYSLLNQTRVVRSQRDLAALATAPSNVKISIEGALGVDLNQGKQSIQLTPTDILINAGNVTGTRVMTILGGSGNVGIGVTNPSTRLHVNPGTVTLAGTAAALYMNDTNRGLIYSRTPGGTRTFTSNSPKDGVALYGLLDGCLGTTDVANGGAKSVLSWTSQGRVTINPASTVPVSCPLSVYGFTEMDRGASYIYQNDPNTGSGQFRASIYSEFGVVSGAYGFMTLSDARIKKNITLVKGVLDVIDRVQVVSYEHIDREKEHHVSYGVVAQQLQECVPSAVKQTSDWVPNVYQKAAGQIVSGQNVHLFFEGRVPEIAGQSLRLIREKGQELVVKVLDQGTHSLVVEGYEITGEVFAYGVKADDFLVVDKMQLGVLALQGTKELLELVKELRGEVKELRGEVKVLRGEMNHMQSYTKWLENELRTKYERTVEI